jgi:hypothetical protein
VNSNRYVNRNFNFNFDGRNPNRLTGPIVQPDSVLLLRRSGYAVLVAVEVRVQVEVRVRG